MSRPIQWQAAGPALPDGPAHRGMCLEIVGRLDASDPIRVKFASPVLARLRRLAREVAPLEAIGLLFGKLSSDGRTLHVEDAIRVHDPRATRVHTELDPNTLRDILRNLPPESQEEHTVVGAWHTHPGMSTRQSGTDAASIQGCLSPESVMLIFDPTKKTVPCSLYTGHSNRALHGFLVDRTLSRGRQSVVWHVEPDLSKKTPISAKPSWSVPVSSARSHRSSTCPDQKGSFLSPNAGAPSTRMPDLDRIARDIESEWSSFQRVLVCIAMVFLVLMGLLLLELHGWRRELVLQPQVVAPSADILHSTEWRTPQGTQTSPLRDRR